MPSDHDIHDEILSLEPPDTDQPKPANIPTNPRPYNFRQAQHPKRIVIKFRRPLPPFLSPLSSPLLFIPH
jgi:hypothetical protein